MLVGVGLTQLYTVPSFLWKASAKMNAQGVGWSEHGQFLVLALFFYFAPGEFWLGYVGTRTILTKLFDVIEGRLPLQSLQKAADPAELRLSPDADKTVAKSSDLGAIDRKLLSLSLQDLTSPIQMAAWGAAQARAGNLSKAQVAFEDARRTAPENPSFTEQLANVYALQGDRAKAQALVSEVPDTEVAVYTALYAPPPDGFKKAIDIGERLLKDPTYAKSASLHVWLASAYGQQYKYEKEHGATDDALREVKQKVLREIDAAIQADPSTKAILQRLWKPEPGSIDDDLATFGPEDTELKSRLT
jgi:hypothetical protein